MDKMTQKDLAKLVDKASVETAVHGKTRHYVVTVEKLNREIRLPAKNEEEARSKALAFMVNEPPRIRGFELDTDEKE